MRSTKPILLLIAWLVVAALGPACRKASESKPATPAASSPAAAVTPPSTPGRGVAAPGAAVPGAAMAPAAPAAKPVPASLPDVLARVNGETISRGEFERMLRQVEQRAGRQVPAEERDRVYRGVLDQLVAFHLLTQEATARKVAVADGEVDAKVAQVRQQFPGEAEFTKALASRGLTLDALRQDMRREIGVEKVLEAEIRPKISVSEGDVKAFYDGNPQQFQQPEAFRASHILIRVDQSAPPAEKQAARKKAEGVLAQVRAGGDFAALARAHSQDGSAPNGGDLGLFGRGQMVAPFEQAVAALGPGEVSGIVETPFGYHIIKLAEKRPARTVPLAEASPRIGQFLMMRARQEKTGEFLRALRARSKVEILI